MFNHNKKYLSKIEDNDDVLCKKRDRNMDPYLRRWRKKERYEEFVELIQGLIIKELAPK